MTVSISVENECWAAEPSLSELAHTAVHAALTGAAWENPDWDVAVLFTDNAAMAEINAEWRGKDTPTNVLSFPTDNGMPVPEGEPRPLGDLVLAYGVIAREAAEHGKTLRDHTTHLIVHGTLHLLGFDHETDEEAEEMEALETRILKGLGVSDPYERD